MPHKMIIFLNLPASVCPESPCHLQILFPVTPQRKGGKQSFNSYSLFNPSSISSSGLQMTAGYKQTYIWVFMTLTLKSRGHIASASSLVMARAMSFMWILGVSWLCGRSHSKEQLSWKCREPG